MIIPCTVLFRPLAVLKNFAPDTKCCLLTWILTSLSCSPDQKNTCFQIHTTLTPKSKEDHAGTHAQVFFIWVGKESRDSRYNRVPIQGFLSLFEVPCSMKDKGFQAEKVALSMAFQTMREKEKRDLAAAKSSADSSSTQPSHQCGLILSKEHMTLKKLWPRGWWTIYGISPWSYSTKQLGQAMLFKISLMQLKVKERKRVREEIR